MSQNAANNPSAYQHPLAVVQHWQTPSTPEPLRADLALVQRVGRLSRNQAKEIILKGDLRLNQLAIKPSKRLQGGETLELWRIPPDKLEDAQDLKVGVIEANSDFLIVNKPPDLAIHPTARYLYRTLTQWLKQEYPSQTPHPCHRLDRETSGIVVCARSKTAQSHLKSAFALGTIEKTYLAIVRGHLSEKLTLSYPLQLQGDAGLVRIRMVHNKNGLASHTCITPLAYHQDTNRTLVRCVPHTGRQHQIRAHLALAGYPIVGDKLYAMGDEFFDAFTQNTADLSLLEHHRQALHAHCISFTFNNQLYTYTAPFPDDLKSLFNIKQAILFEDFHHSSALPLQADF